MERWAKAKNRQVAAKAPPKPEPLAEPEPQKSEVYPQLIIIFSYQIN